MVAGPPRSVMNTYRDSMFSRRSCRSARISLPLSGWTFLPWHGGHAAGHCRAQSDPTASRTRRVPRNNNGDQMAFDAILQPVLFLRCHVVRALRTCRSLNSCGCHGPASPTKCGSSTHVASSASNLRIIERRTPGIMKTPPNPSDREVLAGLVERHIPERRERIFCLSSSRRGRDNIIRWRAEPSQERLTLIIKTPLRGENFKINSYNGLR